VIDWSPDGRYLSYAVSIPIRGAGKIGFCLRLARANRFSALRWVAAVSMMGTFRRTGTGKPIFPMRLDSRGAYAVPFPGPGGKYQIHMVAGGSFATGSRELLPHDLRLRPSELTELRATLVFASRIFASN